MSVEHKTAYMLWLERVDEALVKEGKRSLFSFQRSPMRSVPGGEEPDEPGDTLASDVDLICRKHGIEPFRYAR